MKFDFKTILASIAVILVTTFIVGGTLWFGIVNAIDEKSDHIKSLESQADVLTDIYQKKVEEKKVKDAEKVAIAAQNALSTKKATKKSTPESSTPEPVAFESSSEPTSEPEAEIVQIYYFFSPECGACTIQTPIVLELQSEGIPFAILDVLANPGYIGQYGISFVPTFILNGHKEVEVYTKDELLNFWNTYK